MTISKPKNERRCVVKKILTLLLAIFSLPVMQAASIEDAYDLYSPKGSSTHLGIWISGNEIRGNRISFSKGKNPLVVADEETKKTLEPDPSGCKTVYCFLGFHGGEADRSFRLHGSVRVEKNKWTRVVVTFIPRKSGKIRFSMGGGGGSKLYPDKTPYKYRDIVFRRFAGLTCENTTFKDPKFTSTKTWRTARNWHFNSIKAEVITDSECPERRCFRVLSGLSQDIPVKENKMVTIMFYYRSDDCFDGKM